MLLSMTGHGEGHAGDDSLKVLVELRSINNRFLKVNVRCTDGFGQLDPKIEDYLRQQVKRGTVSVNVRIERQLSSSDIQVNQSVLNGYLATLREASQQTNQTDIRAEWLLGLPGVLQDPNRGHPDLDEVWPVIQQAIDAALDNLQQMRQREGEAMQRDLSQNCKTIGAELELVVSRAPAVIENYQTRLTEKLQKLLDSQGVQAGPVDIVREVGILADRCDISEEVVRLRSHLEQFAEVMKQTDSNGRKLDFITQEMFRETNTIGSKANDAQIAKHVVEIKTVIERIREMVQNIE